MNPLIAINFGRNHPEHADSICEFLDNNDLVVDAIVGLRGGGEKPVVDTAFAPTMDSHSQNPSKKFEIGDSLRYVGEYEIVDEIARGGMGIVFRARQSKLRRDVALKMILSGRLASEADVDRFHREARAAAALKHPNIVSVHEVGQHEGHHYFTMDFVDGRSLASIISEETLSPRKAAELLKTVALAIEYSHEHGVLHRDLKPANILIDADGQPHVTDFGLAKTLAEDATNVDLTATGQILGTPSYMSPEQAGAKHQLVSVASDVYSLGAIMYACLSGRGPFVADSAVDTIRQVLEKEPVALRLLSPQVPRDLETICLKCLQKEPSKRYGSAEELAHDLGRFLDGRPIAARPVGVVGKTVRWCRRNPLVAALLMMVTLSLAGGTAGSTHFAIQENHRADAEADERQRADDQTEIAIKAQQQTAEALQAARTAEAIASQERETARQALAKSQLDLAEREFERGKFVEAQKILGETPEDFRDENWRFLAAHSRDFTAQLSIPRVGSALQVRFLPQEDRIAARFVYGRIGIFSVTGQRMGPFLGTSASRVSFDLDRTGNRLAYARSAREVVVQDVATGQVVRSWQCNIGRSGHVMLSPDGEVVLAAGVTQLTAYSTQTDSPLWTRPYHGVSPAFSPDGRMVAILASKVGLELNIQLLETATGKVVRTLDATADNPEKTSLQFNQSGDRLACLGGDEMILWDPQTAAKIRALHFPGETVIRLSPDGTSVATISGARIRLWDSPSGRLLRSLNGAGDQIRELAFSPDGKLLLSAQVSSNDAEINVWPTRLAEEIASVRFSPGESNSRSVIFDHDASKFYASVDRSAGAWETRSGSQTWKHTTPNNIRDLTIHPVDGSILLSRWGRPRFTHVSPTGEALDGAGISIPLGASLGFNRTGELLLTVEGAFNNTAAGQSLSVFEYPSGNVLRKISFADISGEIDPYQPFAAFCLDDAAVATASKAGGITVWDWKAGTPLREIDATQTGSIAALASSPDGRHLATCGPDRWIRVWEAATGRLETAFRAHWEGVTFVKFSPDGRDILSGSETGVVRIHDAATGEERLALYGLSTPVRDADFSPDGTLIAAITKDGITTVWDRKISSAAAKLPERDENWQEAIELYSKLITDQTTDASLLSKRAMAYIATEQWDLAKADWRRVIEQQPYQLQQAFDVFCNAEQWSTAAELGQRLIEQKPDNSLLWLIVAPVIVLSGDEAAYAEFCQWIAQQPTEKLYPAERAIKSSLLRAGGVNLTALPVATLNEALDSGRALGSFGEWGWGTRVLLAYRLGDADLAVKYFAKSEEHNPRGFVRAVTLSILALAQHELQESDNARKSLEEASQVITRLKEDPNNKGHYNLMIAEILFREAEAKITGKNDSADESSTSPEKPTTTSAEEPSKANSDETENGNGN